MKNTVAVSVGQILTHPFRWVFMSIRRKAIAGLLVILLSAVFVIGLSIISQARNFILAEVQRRAASVARFVGSDLSLAATVEDSRHTVRDVVQRICEDPSIIYASVFDLTGKVLEQNCSRPGYEIRRSLPLSELYDLSADDVKYHVSEDVLEVYSGFNVSTEGQTWFFLLGFDITDVSAIVAKITRLIALNAFIVYILGLLALIAAVNRLTEPLENLTEGIKDLGLGKTPPPVPVRGYDEVGTLSANFNKMVEELVRYRQEVDNYQKHLEEMVVDRTEALNVANSELVRINESLKGANEKLLELDKLKSNFLGIATHELKTPLSVVGGYLDSLQDGFAGELSDSQSGIVSEALGSCHRMEALISDMLDLAKIEAGRMPMEVGEMPVIRAVHKVAGQMIPLLQKKKLTLDILEDGMEAAATFDEDRVIQVLINLVGNAIKFTPENGKITVLARHGRRTDPAFLELIVADTGIGISREDLPHIFEEFAQVGPPGKVEGTGLGLAICKRIVQAHGGKIWAESALGEGTTFHFTLPLVK
ncbi:MAG: HAMP domain-containing sensor histidine kinase [bacterium]|nr:HAMP domain-containing sensor histidine kinase [bacterium]